MYGMPDRGNRPSVTVHGTVSSLETGEPIRGISIQVTNRYAGIRSHVYSDEDGNFYIDVPKIENYEISFLDTDWESNGGFFMQTTRTVALSDLNDPLNIMLERENIVTIRGVVRSLENNNAISGISIRINIADANYEAQTNDSGNFFIRVPERERYSIYFTDTENKVFRTKTAELALRDINDPLNVVLEDKNFITVHGLVQSASTREYIGGILIVLKRAEGEASDINYIVSTDDTGYFHIRMPRWKSYSMNISDPRKVFRDGQVRIRMSDGSDDDLLLSIDLEEREP
jgi:predicted RNase H-like HicB family nuclease